MATFRTHDDWHRYYATEGFRVGEATCLQCGYKAAVAIHPETPDTILQCGACGVQNSRFQPLPTPARP